MSKHTRAKSGARSAAGRTRSSARPLQWLLLTVLAALLGCEGREARDKEPREEEAARGSVATPAATPAAPPRATSTPCRYRWIPITGPHALYALRDSLGDAGFFEVLKVNRLDLRHIRKGDSLVVAIGPGDSLRCSPFPDSVETAASYPKLLLVSLRAQAFAAYERGRLVRWGPTSTGREETPTPARLYHANWKDKERNSTVNDEWHLTWVVNLDNFLGISLHQYELPGRPASHSCVRLLEEDARWLYTWADQWKLTPDGAGVVEDGTPVLVFGEYAFRKPPPWRRLPEDPLATAISPEEISLALAQCLAPSGP